MNKLNVKTAIPFLSSNFVDDEVEFDYQNYSLLLNDNKERLGGFEKYLCRLNDSWIIDLKIEVDKIVLKLNDFDTHIFSDVIVDKYDLKIDHDELFFPLELIFTGDTEWHAYTVDDEGDMTETNHIEELDEYLYEQVLHIDERKINIAFVFWKKEGDRLVVEIMANNLIVNELQKIAWQNVFEGQFIAQLNFFNEIRFSNYHSFGIDYCKNLLNEFNDLTTKE